MDYDPTQVVELHGTLGYQTFVEFAPEEHIENVAIGDATGWQVTPNRAANLLFVKPMTEGPGTNMTVVTNLRRYALCPHRPPPYRRGDHGIVYTLRFQYPEAAIATIAKAAPAAPQAPPLPKVAMPPTAMTVRPPHGAVAHLR